MNANVLLYLLSSYFADLLHTKAIHFFSCAENYEHVEIAKRAAIYGIQLSISTTINDKNWTLSTAQDSLESSSLGIILNIDCEQSTALLKSCSASCFNERYKWLIFEENQPISTSVAIGLLERSFIFVDAEIAYLNMNEPTNYPNEDISYKIYDIYNNARSLGGKLNVYSNYYLIIDKLGNCSISQANRPQSAKYKYRREMSDITLRAGFVLPNYERFQTKTALMAYMSTDNDTSIDSLSRFPVNLLMPLFEIVQSNLQMIMYNSWVASYDKNNLYGGVVKAIADDEIDILIGNIGISTERSPFYTPIIQLYKYESFFFFRTTTDIELWRDEFLKPFSSAVWITLVISIILISILIRVTFVLHKQKVQRQMTDSSSFLITFGAFCQQGAHFTPFSLSGRCLFLTLFLLSTLIYNFYTSILVSTLIQSSPQNRIKSIKDLADSKLEVGFDDIFHMKLYLNSSQTPDNLYFVQKKAKKDETDIDSKFSFLGARDGFEIARRERYAFHCDAQSAFPIIQEKFDPHEICDLNSLPFRPSTLIGFVIRKNSPFHTIFAAKTYWMLETGVFAKHVRHWIIKMPKCSYSSTFSSVGLDYMAGIFSLIILLYLFSLFIMICENIYFCSHKAQNPYL